MPRSRSSPVDGVRALSSLSLVALHTTLLATAALPYASDATARFMHHPLFAVTQGGGCQVDVFLLLSGYLTARNLSSAPDTSFASAIISRACRLWPALLGLAMMQQLLGDDQPANRVHIAQVLGFVNNMFDVRVYGTMTMTVAWSVCVDLHTTAIIHAVWRVCRRHTSAAAAALFALYALSFAIRYLLQDPEKYSLIRLGDHTHFGAALTTSSLKWLKAHYGVDVDVGVYKPVSNETWASVHATSAYAHEYLNRLYFPTHARFGPATLGAAFALIAPSTPAARRGVFFWLRRTLGLVAQLMAFGVIAGTLVPPPSDGTPPPSEAHLGITVALHNVFALAAGVLLLGADAPPGSALENPVSRTVLGWSGWRVVAGASYALNMVHFRILMELVFRSTSALASASARGNAWPSVGALYVTALLLSLVVAHAFTAFCEPPLRGALRALLGLSAGPPPAKPKAA